MKHLFSILAVSVLILFAACNPKSGDKMAKSAPNATPKKQSTIIPIPTGDVRKTAPLPGTPPEIRIGQATNFTLENGLKVIVVENHKLPKVSFRLFVDHAPVTEGEAAGYLDLFGDLLAKGTKTRSKAQIDTEIDFLGASLDTDVRGFRASCLSRHTEKLLGIAADILLNPTFPEEEFEKSKKRQLGGLAQSKDNADAIGRRVGAVLRNTTFHPYGEVTTEESLGKATLVQVKKHYFTYFKPNVSYLVVTGDINPKQAEKLAKKYFGAWQRGEVPKHNYIQPEMPEKTKISFVNKPGAVQSVINVTYPVDLHPASPDVIPARVMNTLLGGYFNSRINDNLREKHAYTYGARSELSSDEIIGRFNANASVRNAVTDSSVHQLIFELSRIRDEKVPSKELQLVKNVLTGSFSRSLEEPATIANFALNMARFKLPADYYEKYLARLNSVSIDEIQMMAKKYVHPAQAHILVVGNRDEVAEKLRKFSLDGKIQFLDTNGKPEKQMGKIPEGMTAEKVLADYTAAVGGLEKIKSIRDVRTEMNMTTGGPILKAMSIQQVPDKYLYELQMNGQTMSKQILNGDKNMETGMGGAVRSASGEALAMLKESAMPCREAFYIQNGYKIELKGVENIDDKPAYLLEIIRPDGSKFLEYYDLASSLKVREIISMTEGEQKMTMQNDFSDYREVGGVMFPHQIMMGGIMPTPIKATVTTLNVNAGVDAALFEVK